jgi:hypothetical protein
MEKIVELANSYMSKSFREVTQEEFFQKINKLDVHPYPKGKENYVSVWKTKSERVVGISYNETSNDRTIYPIKSKYFIN